MALAYSNPISAQTASPWTPSKRAPGRPVKAALYYMKIHQDIMADHRMHKAVMNPQAPLKQQSTPSGQVAKARILVGSALYAGYMLDTR